MAADTIRRVPATATVSTVAASAAALTVYDMCKALQKDMVIGPTQLMAKTGGKSGDYQR